jgi:hypothetical protein
MKPTVRFIGNAVFFNYYTNEKEDELTKDTVARVSAVDHPIWGKDTVRTSVVLQKFSDGSFETMNTVYRPLEVGRPLQKEDKDEQAD